MLYRIVRSTTDDNGNGITMIYYVMASSFAEALQKWTGDDPVWHRENEVTEIVKLSDVVIGA